MAGGWPNLIAGNCRLHKKPLPCHFASFDFAVRAGDIVEIGTAEYQTDGTLLVDVVGTSSDVSRQVQGHGDFRFVLRSDHFPPAQELQIMRLPLLGTIEFERRALEIGDSIQLADLGSRELVFDLRSVDSREQARESEAHEETSW